MKEKNIDEAVRRRIKKYRAAGVPIYAFKSISQGRQRKGLPDWHVTYHGKSFWIENKLPGKDATPLQAAELKRWEASGATVGVAHSVDEFFGILDSAYPLPAV